MNTPNTELSVCPWSIAVVISYNYLSVNKRASDNDVCPSTIPSFCRPSLTIPPKVLSVVRRPFCLSIGHALSIIDLQFFLPAKTTSRFLLPIISSRQIIESRFLSPISSRQIDGMVHDIIFLLPISSRQIDIVNVHNQSQQYVGKSSPIFVERFIFRHFVQSKNTPYLFDRQGNKLNAHTEILSISPIMVKLWNVKVDPFFINFYVKNT